MRGGGLPIPKVYKGGQLNGLSGNAGVKLVRVATNQTTVVSGEDEGGEGGEGEDEAEGEDESEV